MGFAAGILTTVGFIPQVVRSYRTKKVHDVSLVQPMILLAGMTLWLAYGLHLGNAAIVFTNIVSLVLNGFLIVLKLKYER